MSFKSLSIFTKVFASLKMNLKSLTIFQNVHVSGNNLEKPRIPWKSPTSLQKSLNFIGNVFKKPHNLWKILRFLIKASISLSGKQRIMPHKVERLFNVQQQPVESFAASLDVICFVTHKTWRVFFTKPKLFIKIHSMSATWDFRRCNNNLSRILLSALSKLMGVCSSLDQ
jgi:hypothetical protein